MARVFRCSSPWNSVPLPRSELEEGQPFFTMAPYWKTREWQPWATGSKSRSRTWLEKDEKDKAEAEDDKEPCTEEDLYVAVQALYLDEVYPQDVMLQWMLSGYKDVTVEEIQRVADKSATLQVEHGSSNRKGFAVLLADPPMGFRGFDEGAEQVPLDLFEEAVMLVLGGGWPKPDRSSHDRISIAAWLHQREPLQKLTLGKCLSIVNLLLASHSVIGKRQGRLVPYFVSEEYEKQENARHLLPTSLREDEVWVDSWDDLISFMELLLQDNGGKMMSARLKVEIRTRFQVELSETALGYTSLGALLEDQRIQHHFEVRKSPPAADLILLRQWKVSGSSAGERILAQLQNSTGPESCGAYATPIKQASQLPSLPLPHWEIVSRTFMPGSEEPSTQVRLPEEPTVMEV
ncbi:unnamed protein product [Durusdinium trenchii]|uniref:HTH OST-type domain-containing protein n=1 Tax=Durusdinium trenchii TaxID=1381693 RepID=A0ABP0KVH3_9DINO